jgi:hypothetical protein
MPLPAQILYQLGFFLTALLLYATMEVRPPPDGISGAVWCGEVRWW